MHVKVWFSGCGGGCFCQGLQRDWKDGVTCDVDIIDYSMSCVLEKQEWKEKKIRRGKNEGKRENKRKKIEGGRKKWNKRELSKLIVEPNGRGR
jgi:hypothetical protein